MLKRLKLNFDLIKQFHHNNKSCSNAFLVLSCFFSLLLIAPLLNILFELKPQITDFSSHIISNAALNDLDIATRVSYYYRTLLGILILTVLFYVFFFKIVFHDVERIKLKTKLINAIKTSSSIGILAIFASFLIIKIDIAIFFLAILCAVFFLATISKKNIDFDLSIWSVLIAFQISQFVFVFFKKHNFFEKLNQPITLKGIALPVEIQMLFFVFLFFVCTFFCYLLVLFLFRKTTKTDFQNQKNKFLKATIPVLIVPIALSILLEFGNILNVRFSYVFNKPFLLYFFLLFIAFIVSFIIYIKKTQKEQISLTVDIINKYYYPLFLLGIALFVGQPWRIMSPPDEFYEMANHGLAVDHFFRYGSIPLVENYDAHMLSNQFFSFIYGFLNGYEPWAPFSYMVYYNVAAYLVFFYLIKRVLGSLFSFLLLFSISVLSAVINEFIFAGILALFIYKLLNHTSTKNFYKFWAITIFLCLFRLDLGFAAIFAGTITFLSLNYLANRKFDFLNFFKTGAISALSIIVLFCILCLVKSINPIFRLQEFLLASMSNQNWAVVKMGDMSHIAFRVSYYIFPILGFVSLGIIIFKYLMNPSEIEIIKNNKKLFNALIFFVFFCLFFILNIPRGIVRHNFEYGNIIRITSTLPLAMLMLTLVLSKSNRILKFLTVLVLTYFFTQINTTSFKNLNNSLLYESVYAPSFHEKFLEAQDFNGTRVRESFDFSEFKTLKQILDLVLKPDETYFDFSSKNYYHALVERKNPCYLNQTPLMINGDKGQEYVLEQIKNAKIPVVLMPVKNIVWSAIDEVYVDYKYFRISEYLYANYTPVFRMGTFDIYAINSQKNNFTTLLKNKGFFDNKIIIDDFKFLNSEKITKSNLQITIDTNGKAQVSNIATNAFFSGLIETLKQNNKAFANLKTSFPTTFTFKINATSPGSIKFYYNTNVGDSYAEERMKEIPIKQIGESEISVNFAKLPSELMIAVNTKDLKFENLTVSSGSTQAINNPEMLDYWLANVPRLWAEKTNEQVFNQVSTLKEPITEASLTFNKTAVTNFRKPYYLYLEATTDLDLGAHVSLKSDGLNQAIFHFNIIPGKHSYAIRLSSSFYWWNLDKNQIVLSIDKPVEISKIAIISEDGLNQTSYKSGGLTLSSITDENWTGGVGLTYNMLLIDSSPTKEKLLKTATKIKFTDGSFATIAGYSLAGNYIQITVKENTKELIKKASYPNLIEIIN